MNNSLQKAITAGVGATVIMTMVTYIAPLMGLPEMNIPAMLSGMTGFPIVVGWIMHFMIGIMFALGYSFFFLSKVHIHNRMVKGVVFGVTVFIVAQIAIAMMGAVMGSQPSPEGTMLPMLAGSLIGHIMYGIPVAFLVTKPQ